jgi:hypothetical protein
MMQTVYHGSPYIVENPEWGKGRPYNDYGLGYYLTKNKELAGEWAVFTTGQNGYVNEYELDYTGLNVLRLDELPVEVWLSVLINNRRGSYKKALQNRVKKFVDKYGKDISSYDIIEGYRADDAFFSYVRDFTLGLLSIEGLKKAMSFGDLGLQVCLKSQKAFSKIKFIKAKPVSSAIYYSRAKERDDYARKQYHEIENPERGTIIFDLIGRDS